MPKNAQHSQVPRAQQLLEKYDDIITSMMKTMDNYATSVGGYLGRDRSKEAIVRKDLSEYHRKPTAKK